MGAPDKKIIFWGTPSFSVPSLQALIRHGLVTAVISQRDKRQGRGRSTLVPTPVKQAALEAGLPVLQPDRLDAAFDAELQQLLPATFLVVAYGKLIPDRVLQLSELPAINLHPSLLPELRGPSPISHAILNGLSETGLTLMQLDAEMDHGPILVQEAVPLDARETTTSLAEKLRMRGADFLAEHVPNYLAGQLVAVPQDHTRATFTKLLTTEDGRLDLNAPAEALDLMIRALNPWPGSWIMLKDKRLKILSAVPVADQPQKLFAKTPAGLLRIRCGEGALDVDRVQLEGSAAMTAKDFLNGHATLIE